MLKRKLGRTTALPRCKLTFAGLRGYCEKPGSVRTLYAFQELPKRKKLTELFGSAERGPHLQNTK